MLPVSVSYAAKVLIAEPCCALMPPLLMLLLGRLPDGVRGYLQYTLIVPLTGRVKILANLLSRCGL